MATTKTSTPNFAKVSIGKATSHSAGSGSKTMAELMARHTSSFKSFKKGETLEGIVTKLTPSEILVDIGAKTEAQVFEKDKGILKSILSAVKLGDKVSVYILNPESDLGYPVVSLRKFIDERQWGDLEKLQKAKTIIEVSVVDSTKGGFLVEADSGKEGFLPNSHAMLSESAGNIIGRKIKVILVELSREQNKIIFSQKAAIDPGEFKKSVEGIKEGATFDTKISNLTNFGIFVSFNYKGKDLEAFIHSSELSWERAELTDDKYKPGQKLTAQVIGIDNEAKRVNLSVKRLTADPFEEATKEYTQDKKIKGKITFITDLGITLDLGNDIEGFIKKDKVPLNISFSPGQEIEASVSEIDKKRRKVILTPVLKEKPIGYR